MPRSDNRLLQGDLKSFSFIFHDYLKKTVKKECFILTGQFLVAFSPLSQSLNAKPIHKKMCCLNSFIFMQIKLVFI